MVSAGTQALNPLVSGQVLDQWGHPLPDDARIEVVVATHRLCWSWHAHPGTAELGLLAYAWSPIGLWIEMCLDCALERQRGNVQPMIGYEPCEEHRCAREDCKPRHS